MLYKEYTPTRFNHQKNATHLIRSYGDETIIVASAISGLMHTSGLRNQGL